jgi:hypothetical protein
VTIAGLSHINRARLQAGPTTDAIRLFNERVPGIRPPASYIMSSCPSVPGSIFERKPQVIPDYSSQNSSRPIKNSPWRSFEKKQVCCPRLSEKPRQHRIEGLQWKSDRHRTLNIDRESLNLLTVWCRFVNLAIGSGRMTGTVARFCIVSRFSG